jgi:phage major head subunit gpT-like protein
MAELQGDASARWPDDIVTAALIAGTTTNCYDGQFFFDTDHPVDFDDASAGTYANYHTGTALTQANYNTVYATMQGRLGESGKPLEVQPTILMVPPSLRQTGMQILQAQLIAQAQTNMAGSENVGASAPTNVFQGDCRLIVNPRLVADTTGAWYLISTDRIRPMIFQQREAPTRTQIIDPANPVVFNQDEWQFGVKARGAAGYGLPFLIDKSVP